MRRRLSCASRMSCVLTCSRLLEAVVATFLGRAIYFYGYGHPRLCCEATCSKIATLSWLVHGGCETCLRQIGGLMHR
jgi:hypothetical protein